MDDIVNRGIFEELLKNSREANKQDRELAEAMERLVNFEPFQVFLSRVIGPRLQDLGELSLQPALTSDGMVRKEYLHGAMYAFILTRDLPQRIIASMKDIRDASTE